MPPGRAECLVPVCAAATLLLVNIDDPSWTTVSRADRVLGCSWPGSPARSPESRGVDTCSHSRGGRKAGMRVSGPSSLGEEPPTFPWLLFAAGSPPCFSECVRVGLPRSPLWKDTGPVGLGPTLSQGGLISRTSA